MTATIAYELAGEARDEAKEAVDEAQNALGEAADEAAGEAVAEAQKALDEAQKALEEAEEALEEARCAWLDSDDSRDWEVRDEGGGTWTVENESPSSIEAHLEDEARDWSGSSDKTVYWTIWYAPVDPVTGEALDERESSMTATVHPEAPACIDGDHDHDWESPHSVVGGIESNPGVWGNGGGVIIREVCADCGVYKITDTWAQDPETGEQGLTSVEYEDADDASLAWLRGEDEEDEDEDEDE